MKGVGRCKKNTKILFCCNIIILKEKYEFLNLHVVKEALDVSSF
jgi:hypothetical protein